MLERNNVNGLDGEAIETALDVISKKGRRGAPKTARVDWVGGLQFKVHVRDHTFLVDEPTQLTGEDLSPNAVEYVLGAYGACLTTGFIWNATRRGIIVRSMEATLESIQNNSFTFLGIDEEGQGHSGLEEITVKFYVQADTDEATIREIWDHTVKTSPVGNSLTRVVTLKPELEIL